jgi:hypothetical protein
MKKTPTYGSLTLFDYEKVFEMFRSECTRLTDNDLDKVVTFGHENEKQATIRWRIWHSTSMSLN